MKFLESVAPAITHKLTKEAANGGDQKSTSGRGFLRALAHDISEEVQQTLSKPSNDDVKVVSSGRTQKEALQKAEEKLRKLLEKGEGKKGEEDGDNDDEDEVRDPSSRFPNLKYAKPKYHNVESLLNYVEGADGGKPGAVKLVIMNFND